MTPRDSTKELWNCKDIMVWEDTNEKEKERPWKPKKLKQTQKKKPSAYSLPVKAN